MRGGEVTHIHDALRQIPGVHATLAKVVVHRIAALSVPSEGSTLGFVNPYGGM